MTQHVFLLGFMGSGKSHWGRVVAEKTGRPFADLDVLIEERQGKTIPEIFAESGEAGFRELERKYLHTLADFPPSIVATGGGAPCFFDNMDWMKRNGLTVYLKTPPEILLERLKKGLDRRPLLKNLNESERYDFVQNLLQERELFYLRADYTLKHAGDDAAFLKQLLALIDRNPVY